MNFDDRMGSSLRIYCCSFSTTGLSLAALYELDSLYSSTMLTFGFRLVEWRSCVTRMLWLGVRMAGDWVMFLIIVGDLMGEMMLPFLDFFIGD